MPLINLEYDDVSISEADATALSQAIRDIVSEVTDIADVFVYANTARIKIQTAPIEIFIRMSAQKVDDLDALTDAIKIKVSAWKHETGFSHPVNLTLIPMHWKIEIGV